MDFIKVLKGRHSVRSFQDKPVAKQDLESILNNAAHAPSWVNSQEWKVFVAQGETLKNIKAEYTPRSISGEVGHSEITVQHRENFSKNAQQNMAKIGELIEKHSVGELFAQSQHVMYNAPVIMVFCLPKNANEFTVLDLGGFYQSAMLSAMDLGISSIPSYNIVKYPEILRKHLEIDSNYKIVIGVAFGYADDSELNNLTTDRMSLEDFAVFKN